MDQLPPAAKIYIWLVSLLGFGGLVGAIARSENVQWGALALLGLLAVATAGFKISLPGGRTTLSVASCFVLATMILLGTGPAMFVAALSGLAQCVLLPKVKQPFHRTLFSMAALALTAGLSSMLYRALLGPLGPDQFRDSIVALAFATTCYFLLNTVLVSAAVCLASQQAWFATWRRGYLWTAPSFYASSGCSLVASFFAQRFELHAFLIALLPLLLIYFSYRQIVSRIMAE